ncbi:hypothetical protein DFA_04198 [Cavenderia fasciculata]|uniref:Ankyrin repeat-containing protein n=1 Tax=Cavenderia fasciculata TaxID=261658 RepID=F4Q1K1_CACFS|nr:uncharacterized protein DFA_04198 [Cavenderia fasciculata]EGG18702.1 hypothetical protein DFA_04198 [Cavenderia fasciculata]|eukprot:XP_004366606.1 hypothetical protein DFA_04198 [Cavenderia fasciculata]
MDLTTIKCKVCGTFESTSIDAFRLHGINHCIPSVARYFGFTQEQLLEQLQLHQQQQYDEITRENNSTLIADSSSNDNLPNTTTLFKSLIKSPYIRQTIFYQIKEIGYKIINRHESYCGRDHVGKDIIKLPHLGMISKFAMPWNFIKHYLPNKDKVLPKRRWYVISRYCSHQNATLDTLLKLLEWSPDYDPQDQFERCHQNLFYNVASKGHRDILELLLKRYPNIYMNGKYSALNVASEKGHLSTVHLLCSIKGMYCTPDAMDGAAEKGHLDIVKYLDQNRTEGCTTMAINLAAKNGHLDIVQYLKVHQRAGCTTMAIDLAATNGHLNVLKWLDNNYKTKVGCTEYAMDMASENGHFQIVQWLHNNRSVGCTTRAMDHAKSLEIFEYLHRAGKTCTSLAMDNACLKGDLDFVKYLYYNRTEGYSEAAIINACTSGNLELIKVCHMNEVCPPEAVDAAIENECSLDVIQYLDQECTINGLKYAIYKDRLDIFQYLHRRYPNSTHMWTRDVLDEAAKSGKLDIIKFLHENRTERSSTNAMDLAENIEVTKFLHFNRTEGCTTDAMDNAARRGDLETVEFLHENRTEGCTEEALWKSKDHPDIYTYILSNKIVSMESIQNGRIKTLPYEKNQEDNYEIVDLINKYYGIKIN